MTTFNKSGYCIWVLLFVATWMNWACSSKPIASMTETAKVTLNSKENSHGEMSQEAIYHLESPTSWRIEKKNFPSDFATQLAYQGVAGLRQQLHLLVI